MLVKSQYQIIEKIIVSPEGVSFRATFLVYEHAGKIKAKLLKAVQIIDQSCAMLSAPKAPTVNVYIESIQYAPEKIIPSPFTSTLYFNCTIARGPNRA
jgi:hypothetical protein